MANQVIFTMTSIDTGGGAEGRYTPEGEIFQAIKPYGHFISGDETDGVFELYDNSKFVLNCPILSKSAKCISSQVHVVNGQIANPDKLVFEAVDQHGEIYVFNALMLDEGGDAITLTPGIVSTIEMVEIEGEKFLNQDGVGAIRDWVKDGLSTKQDELVSGTTIKTVNNQSLLGSGNIDIQGGIDLEIGAEKWYGTYKEDGVTYQVYSKVLKIAALPSAAGITNYPHGITGIKQILCAYGFGTNGFVLNAPRQNAQDNIAIYQVQKASGGSVAIEVGKDRSSMGAYVCLVYAKNN